MMDETKLIKVIEPVMKEDVYPILQEKSELYIDQQLDTTIRRIIRETMTEFIIEDLSATVNTALKQFFAKLEEKNALHS